MNRFLLMLMMTGACATTGWTQASDTVFAHQAWVKAQQLGKAAQYDSAAWYMEQAAADFSTHQHWVRHYAALDRLAYYWMQNWRYTEARDLLLHALKEAQMRLGPTHYICADLQSHTGRVLTNMGDNLEAIKNYQAAYELYAQHFGHEHKRTTAVMFNLATNHFLMGDYQKAIDLFRDCLEKEIRLYGPVSQPCAHVWEKLGISLGRTGDLDQALSHLQRALEIHQQLPETGPHALPRIYHHQSLLLVEKGEWPRALDLGQKALQLNQEQLGPEHPILAHNLLNLGQIFALQKQYDQALFRYEEAARIHAVFHGKNNPHVADTYEKIGDVYRETGQHKAALSHYQQALQIRHSHFGQRHPVVAKSYLSLARTWEVMEQGHQAGMAWQSALEANTLDFSVPKPGWYPEVAQVLAPLTMLDILRMRLANLEAHPGTREDEEIIQLAQFSARLSDQLRRGYGHSGDKLRLQDQTRTLWLAAIAAAIRRFQESSERSYLEQAFYFAEKSKAALLYDAVKASGARQFAGIPPDLLSLEKALRQALAYYETKGLAYGTASARHTEYFASKQRYDSLILAMERDYPAYYALKYQTQVASLSDLQQQLRAEEAMLVYAVGEEVLYIWVIHRDQITVQAQPTAVLAQSLEPLRACMLDTRQAFAFAEAHSLYQQLVALPLSGLSPACLHSLERIHIVPDAQLGYLAFDALLTEAVPPDQDFRTAPWLLKQYDLSYGYSATLSLAHPRASNSPDFPYLGFAPSYPQASMASLQEMTFSLSALPGARREVIQARQIWQGQAYLDEKATESTFKTLEKWPAVLHLAMHGQVDNGDPLRSCLLFHPDADSQGDGKLFISEIYALSLPSQLAVLSACNTGNGEWHRGEGILSLSRAFMYAGVPAILTHLWPASDQSTHELMGDFMQQLQQEASKGSALRQAKLTYLQQADLLKAHPAHWAGLVLIGDPAPIRWETTAPWNTWGWILLGMGAVGGLLCWQQIRKKASRRGF